MKPAVFVGVVGAVVASVVVATSVLQAQSDPRIGTWKVNLAKSKYDPGPAPKSDTRTYDATADGTNAKVEVVPASGEPTTTTYTAKLDGKDYPVGGNPNFDTISVKRINNRTTDVTLKKGGKVVQTVRGVVSKNGKTMTNTVKGTDASGRPVHNVIVLDKQP